MSRIWQQQLFGSFTLSPRQSKYLGNLQKSADFDHRWWDTCKQSEFLEIKKVIYSQLWRRQRGRCAYCGLLKISEAMDREHVLPKRNYLKLMFHPYNIVLACRQCNRDYKKTTTPLSVGTTHGKWARKYGLVLKSFDYKYWHPHLHDPTAHFVYSGYANAKIESCSPQGQETIRLFGWNTAASVLARIQNELIFEKILARTITTSGVNLVAQALKYSP